ncbi:hypothetical protein SISNIDRAFT_486272 [Sistotremastrum niveocremeum HHB9708]|uniref:Uncharacterized protein n=1 Tax=Sistotremastrum niveocremeum HHB9708 TaxID=1314777 RepID=A0A164TZA9_9AGAM|nr:hypothetical protein SISNIDRAFT_486272 [Sistotremastrum niveocremeum HHB9708]
MSLTVSSSRSNLDLRLIQVEADVQFLKIDNQNLVQETQVLRSQISLLRSRIDKLEERASIAESIQDRHERETQGSTSVAADAAEASAAVLPAPQIMIRKPTDGTEEEEDIITPNGGDYMPNIVENLEIYEDEAPPSPGESFIQEPPPSPIVFSDPPIRHKASAAETIRPTPRPSAETAPISADNSARNTQVLDSPATQKSGYIVIRHPIQVPNDGIGYAPPPPPKVRIHIEVLYTEPTFAQILIPDNRDSTQFTQTTSASTEAIYWPTPNEEQPEQAIPSAHPTESAKSAKSMVPSMSTVPFPTHLAACVTLPDITQSLIDVRLLKSELRANPSSVSYFLQKVTSTPQQSQQTWESAFSAAFRYLCRLLPQLTAEWTNMLDDFTSRIKSQEADPMAWIMLLSLSQAALNNVTKKFLKLPLLVRLEMVHMMPPGNHTYSQMEFTNTTIENVIEELWDTKRELLRRKHRWTAGSG